MTAPVRIQNFSGLRAAIVSHQTDPEQPLAAALQRLGLSVAFCDPELGWPDALDPERDLLIVEGDLHLKGIAGAEECAIADVPVIGLLGVEAPGRLRALMALGATAFLRKPVYGPAVYSAVFLAVNTHRERRHLRAQIAGHERRRGGRRFVIKAVLALMRRDGCDDEQAYEVLRRAAMRERVSIETYCETWIATDADTSAVTRAHAQL
ncbi:MAG: ANTAR domain-containing protein [Proteobacteria bacterium]|nr:ANTAR domain-containing protein [Pseudomonadota bacterium]